MTEVSARAELVRVPDPDSAPPVAADRIATILADAVAARGHAHWAATGGSSAPPLYRSLAAVGGRVPWSDVVTWWGDDRYVPYDHPLSNVLAFEAILMPEAIAEAGLSGNRMDTDANLPVGPSIPPANVHRFPTAEAIAHGRGAAWCAARYAEDLRENGPTLDGDGIPVFDLVVLGVGPDGHILSVFPGSEAFDAREIAVAVPAPTHVEPHVERVTLHPRIVLAARHVVVISTGGGKAGAIANAWRAGDPREVPARLAVRPGATWIVDAAAAGDLPT